LTRLLMDNYFSPVGISRIKVSVKGEDTVRTASITGVSLNKTSFKPGETVEVTVQYQPYRKRAIQVKVPLELPNDIPEGKLVIRVQDPVSYLKSDIQRVPQRYKPRDFNQFLRLLKDEISSNNIVVELSAPYMGVTLPGEEMSSLPASVIAAFSEVPQSGLSRLTRNSILRRRFIPTPYQVFGSKSYSIMVKKGGK